MFERIHISNYKSLSDIRADLGRYNIVVGANDSGKTSFAEVFYLLKLYGCRREKDILRFLGPYGDFVTDGDTSRNIAIAFKYEGKDYTFEFTGRKGVVEIVRTNIDSEIRRVLKRVTVIPPIDYSGIIRSKSRRADDYLEPNCGNLVNVVLGLIEKERRSKESDFVEFPAEIVDDIRVFFEHYIPYLRMEGKEIQLYIKDLSRNKIMPARHVPGGFIKLLAIITAIHLKPSVLVIDEFENALHFRLQELLLKHFLENIEQVIVITHSPIPIEIFMDNLPRSEIKILGFSKSIENVTAVKDFDEEEEIIRFLENQGISKPMLYLSRV